MFFSFTSNNRAIQIQITLYIVSLYDFDKDSEKWLTVQSNAPQSNFN